MEQSGYTYLGTLVKPHGFKGGYLLISELDLPKKIEKWESVFIEVDGLPIPFFISSLRLVSENSVIITFDEITSPEQAREFIGFNVLQVNSVMGRQPKQVTSNGLENYKVFDAKVGYIGQIDSIIEYSQNVLFRILNNNQEILIPAIDEYIVSVDQKKKELHIQTPEGLLDLNN